MVHIRQLTGGGDVEYTAPLASRNMRYYEGGSARCLRYLPTKATNCIRFTTKDQPHSTDTSSKVSKHVHNWSELESQKGQYDIMSEGEPESESDVASERMHRFPIEGLSLKLKEPMSVIGL